MRWKSDILVAISTRLAVTLILISCGSDRLVPGSPNDAGQQLDAMTSGIGGGGGSAGHAGNGGMGALAGSGAGGRAATGGATSAGRGGTTSTTGRGGATEYCLPGTPEECPLTSCGNGVRDPCMVRAGSGFCPLVAQMERCDGSDLNGQTCQTLRYGSGSLACSSVCSLDTKGCSECLPLDTSLLRCGDAPFRGPAIAADVAATDSEVAVTWLEVDATSRPILGFARLTPNLDLVGASRLSSAEESSPIDPSVAKVATVPLPSGWAAVAYYEGELFVHAVSPAGEHVGRIVIEKFANGALGAGPVLASRSNGGPLLVWETAEGIRTSVIAADGRSATPPATIAPATALAGWLSAVVVGDAFHVAFSRDTGANPAQLRLVRIGFDGKIGAAVDALPGLEVLVPKLVTDGTDLRVVYGTSSFKTLWQRISLAGAALSPPVAIALANETTWSFDALSFGSDTVGLFVGAGAVGDLGFVRLASDGRLLTPPRAIAQGPFGVFGGVNAARRGPDVIMLWGTLRLARVTM